MGKTGLRARAHPGGCWLPLWPERALGARPAPHLGRWDPSRHLQGALRQPTSPERGRGAPGGEGPGVCPWGACAFWCRAEDSGSTVASGTTVALREHMDGTVASMDSPRVGVGRAAERRERALCGGVGAPVCRGEEGQAGGAAETERTAPSKAVRAGSEAPTGCGAPRLRTAGAGRGPWSPEPAEGARPWCPFRRLPAYSGLQHPQVGGQPAALQRKPTPWQGGGRRPGPRPQERCAGAGEARGGGGCQEGQGGPCVQAR